MTLTITVGDTLQNYDCTFSQRMADVALAEKKEVEKRQRERRSPFKKFAQLNLEHDACVAVRQLIRVSPVAAQIWNFLLEHADKYNAVVCSVKVLEEALGYTKQSITKALKVLRDMKFVDVKKSGVTNIYLLNKTLTWQSWGTNYEYAEFDAKVIITKSEQEKNAKTTKMNVVSLKKDSQPTRKASQQTEESEWEDEEDYNESCLPDEGECPED